ncbi:hypothetical protein CDL15_Pgr012162 [Punica granatum]|uniref:25S rRNA (uridine-N(3))-methyltransferase BMT5-like domain-containing protein n=1 Tax=Punica granatum TaxID=22663 RepID=A0A218XNQ0_PUNGR|nr:hypothetical protein CDL15_Pgr012162 [Punica granatum]
MLSNDGQVHITHKMGHPFSAWNVVSLAKEVGLYLFDKHEFKLSDYQGYQNKREAGDQSDGTFPNYVPIRSSNAFNVERKGHCAVTHAHF